MKILAARACGRYKSNSKTASPVAKQIRQTGGFVVLVRPQLRVRNDIDGYEEEPVSEALKCPGKCVVSVVGPKVKRAVVPHGSRTDNKANDDQPARMHKAALDELCADGGEHGNDKCSGTQHEARVDGAISIERLQHLRNQRRASEESKSKDEEQNSRNCEVAISQHSKVNDRIFQPHFPDDGSDPSNDGDGEHPADETAAEPILDLAAIEGDFEGCRCQCDQCDSDSVDPQPAILSNRGSLGIECRWIFDQPAAHK